MREVIVTITIIILAFLSVKAFSKLESQPLQTVVCSGVPYTFETAIYQNPTEVCKAIK